MDAAVIHICREFTIDPRQLAELRGVVRDSCRQVWGDDAHGEALDRIELAVQEAAANILLHAYRGNPEGVIRLELAADPDRLQLTMLHDGADFDPTTVPPPSFDGSRYGGFGVYLIHQCMDGVRYIHGEVGRRGIRLVKHRVGPARGKPMNLLVETFGDVTVVTLNAEQLEVGNADDIKAGMEPVLRDTRKLVLDLSRVEFVDSRGCGVILSCLKNLAERGGDLKLCRVNKPVRTVFDLIRLYKMCEITDTREQAMAAFKQSGDV
ncbi:MAG TPA: anti-sigma factor antagonist [Gemmataceae bacterium]|nr:anti-sigma factor antagonist [Gemmataceae bacterium]